MWHSEADIINDLAALNDFGEPENTEPYKILCSIGRGSKTEKKPQPKRLLDPRTGEEIELGDHCLSVEDMLCRGKGRGSLLSTRNYNLLHKQLRLARPLGSGDEIIESYCRRNNSPVKVEVSPESPNIKSTNATEKPPDASYPKSSIKSKSRVKAVRNSNLFNNALITSLLRGKDISFLSPGIEKSNIANEPEVLKNGDEDYAFDFQNYESLKNETSEINLHLNNLFIWENGEDAPAGSECNSSKSSNRGETVDEIKMMGNESCKSFIINLSEDFNSDLSLSTEDDEDFHIALKKESEIRNTSSFTSAEQKLDRDEMYRKLGERMNKINMSRDQGKKQESCFSATNLRPVNKNLSSRDTPDFGSFPNGFVYDGMNFPPLV